MYISIMHHTSSCGTRNIVQENNFVGIIKKNWLKVYISLMGNKLACFRYPQFGSWFLKKTPTRSVFLHCGAPKHQKSGPARHRIQNIIYQILQFFQPWTIGFYWYEHVYTYGRQEFQNIFERKLCSCMRKLLLIY